jgi:hypothetical protein
VKNEGFNLNAMTFALKFVVNCETLSLQESFNGTYFGHVFPKACQNATIDEKMCKNLINVSIKIARTNLQKYIT